jgi:hypothetical protein
MITHGSGAHETVLHEGNLGSMLFAVLQKIARVVVVCAK